MVAAAPPEARKRSRHRPAISPSGELKRGRFGHRDSDPRESLTYAGHSSVTPERDEYSRARPAAEAPNRKDQPRMPLRQQNVFAAQWDPNGDRARRSRSHRRRQPDLRRERLQPGHPAPAAAQGRLQAPVQDPGQGLGARHLAGRRRRPGHEGVGDGEGRHPLQPRVPAPDRADGREARQLLLPHRRGHGAGRVLGQGADPGRARRLVVPHRRHPRHLRGPRLHGLGSHLARLHPREPQRRAALHPDRVRVLDRRGARPQDPAAALDGRPVQVGHARAEAVRQPRGRRACSRPSGPSRSTS